MFNEDSSCRAAAWGNFAWTPVCRARLLRYGSDQRSSPGQPIGKLLIQGAINPLGVDMIAANAVNLVTTTRLLLSRDLQWASTTSWPRTGSKKTNCIQKRLSPGGLLPEARYWVPFSRHRRGAGDSACSLPRATIWDGGALWAATIWR